MTNPSPDNLPGTPGAPRILLVRLGAIGDVLMASPVPQALREALPAVHITWMVEPLSVPLVRANPYVDEVLVLDRLPAWQAMLSHGQIVRLVREIAAYGRELRQRRFDIAIDLQGLLKSAVLARLSGAPRRIAASPAMEMSHLFMTDLVPSPPRLTRLTQWYMHILAGMQIDHRPRRPVLAIPAEDRAAAREFLTGHGVTTPYVACCISASRPQKNWVWERWGALADHLQAQFGLRTVLIGGPELRVDARDLVARYASSPISAVGELPLLQSAALVQDAAAVVGVDTGLTYAGLATDTPTIGLYGSTHVGWFDDEPFAAECYHALPCSPCHRRPTCEERYDCMAAITVEEIATTLRQLRDRTPPSVSS